MENKLVRLYQYTRNEERKRGNKNENDNLQLAQKKEVFSTSGYSRHL